MSNVPASNDLDELLAALEFTEGVAWRCATVGYYFEKVSNHPRDEKFWIIVQNSLGESFCLLWCHLFGSREDDLHYSQLFSRAAIRNLGTSFEPVNVKSRLCRGAAIDESTYRDLWNEMKRCRDKFIAHRELESSVTFPRTDLCLRIVEELRAVLADCVRALHDSYPANTRIQGLCRFYRDNSSEFLRRCSHNQFVTGLRSGAAWADELVATQMTNSNSSSRDAEATGQ